MYYHGHFTPVSHTAFGSKLEPGAYSHIYDKDKFQGKPSAIWRGKTSVPMSWKNFLSVERKKIASLIILALSTTSLVLTIRYSRTADVIGPRYLTSTAVVLAEVIKLLICTSVISFSGDKTWSQISSLGHLKDILRLAVPSGLYTVQNNLQFVAVSNLDAATFQVLYQLKILSTAILSVLFLQKHLNNLKWVSLFLLTCGVLLIQGSHGCHGDDCLENEEKLHASWITGVSAVIFMSLSSGFAGVYFEKVLKTSQPTLWTRNIQMALSGVIFGSICILYRDMEAIATYGFFQGYGLLTWCIIFQQAVLGLVVSLVIKHADNILKGFANATSIVLTSFVSHVFLADLSLNLLFVAGASIVVIASGLYGIDGKYLHTGVKESKEETI